MWNGFAGSPHQIYHLLNYRNHYSFIEESLKLSLKDMFYWFKWGLNAFFFLVINSHTWIFLAIQQVLVLLIILLIKQGSTSLFCTPRNTFCRCPREALLPIPSGCWHRHTSRRWTWRGNTRKADPLWSPSMEKLDAPLQTIFAPSFPFKTLKHLQWETKG